MNESINRRKTVEPRKEFGECCGSFVKKVVRDRWMIIERDISTKGTL